MPHGICRPAEQARQSLSSLSKLSLEDFRNVEQSANAARNAQKAKYQGMLSLYLNVIYQIIKNMVYINSRYVLAFAKYEHDASLLLDGWVYDRYKTVFSDLTVGSLQKGKLNRRASKYLQVNLEHSDTDLIRQYRNKVAHLNAMFDLMSKYYPNIAELSKDEVAKQAPFGAKWRLLAQVEVRCYILISNISGSVKVAPLQILQFPVILPHKFQDAGKFNLQFSDFSEITETADKLRWLRYQKGLRQRDVADYAGIYRSTYIHYEEYGKDFYSPKHMEKIAQLFEVPVERLLDDYNLFLRNGQGKQIKAIRMKLGLTQREYADRLGISLCNLKQWEQNRKQLFKSTWEKYFK